MSSQQKELDKLIKSKSQLSDELEKLKNVCQVEIQLKSIDSDGLGLDRAGQALGQVASYEQILKKNKKTISDLKQQLNKFQNIGLKLENTQNQLCEITNDKKGLEKLIFEIMSQGEQCDQNWQQLQKQMSLVKQDLSSQNKNFEKDFNDLRTFLCKKMRQLIIELKQKKARDAILEITVQLESIDSNNSQKNSNKIIQIFKNFIEILSDESIKLESLHVQIAKDSEKINDLQQSLKDKKQKFEEKEINWDEKEDLLNKLIKFTVETEVSISQIQTAVTQQQRILAKLPQINQEQNIQQKFESISFQNNKIQKSVDFDFIISKLSVTIKSLIQWTQQQVENSAKQIADRERILALNIELNQAKKDLQSLQIKIETSQNTNQNNIENKNQKIKKQQIEQIQSKITTERKDKQILNFIKQNYADIEHQKQTVRSSYNSFEIQSPNHSKNKRRDNSIGQQRKGSGQDNQILSDSQQQIRSKSVNTLREIQIQEKKIKFNKFQKIDDDSSSKSNYNYNINSQQEVRQSQDKAIDPLSIFYKIVEQGEVDSVLHLMIKRLQNIDSFQSKDNPDKIQTKIVKHQKSFTYDAPYASKDAQTVHSNSLLSKHVPKSSLYYNTEQSQNDQNESCPQNTLNQQKSTLQFMSLNSKQQSQFLRKEEPDLKQIDNYNKQIQLKPASFSNIEQKDYINKPNNYMIDNKQNVQTPFQNQIFNQKIQEENEFTDYNSKLSDQQNLENGPYFDGDIQNSQINIFNELPQPQQQYFNNLQIKNNKQLNHDNKIYQSAKNIHLQNKFFDEDSCKKSILKQKKEKESPPQYVQTFLNFSQNQLSSSADFYKNLNNKSPVFNATFPEQDEMIIDIKQQKKGTFNSQASLFYPTANQSVEQLRKISPQSLKQLNKQSASQDDLLISNKSADRKNQTVRQKSRMRQKISTINKIDSKNKLQIIEKLLKQNEILMQKIDEQPDSQQIHFRDQQPSPNTRMISAAQKLLNIRQKNNFTPIDFQRQNSLNQYSNHQYFRQNNNYSVPIQFDIGHSNSYKVLDSREPLTSSSGSQFYKKIDDKFQYSSFNKHIPSQYYQFDENEDTKNQGMHLNYNYNKILQELQNSASQSKKSDQKNDSRSFNVSKTQSQKSKKRNLLRETNEKSQEQESGGRQKSLRKKLKSPAGNAVQTSRSGQRASKERKHKFQDWK